MTSDDSNESIIIEPYRDERQADPTQNKFVLYDEDFPEETDARFQPLTPKRALRRPHFSVGEIGPWVFGRNIHWLRNELKNHPPHLNGRPLEFRFITGRANKPQRRLTLSDIERLAWAMNQRGAIDGRTLQRASDILERVALQYGCLRDKNGNKVS